MWYDVLDKTTPEVSRAELRINMIALWGATLSKQEIMCGMKFRFTFILSLSLSVSLPTHQVHHLHAVWQLQNSAHCCWHTLLDWLLQLGAESNNLCVLQSRFQGRIQEDAQGEFGGRFICFLCIFFGNCPLWFVYNANCHVRPLYQTHMYPFSNRNPIRNERSPARPLDLVQGNNGKRKYNNRGSSNKANCNVPVRVLAAHILVAIRVYLRAALATSARSH